VEPRARRVSAAVARDHQVLQEQYEEHVDQHGERLWSALLGPTVSFPSVKPAAQPGRGWLDTQATFEAKYALWKYYINVMHGMRRPMRCELVAMRCELFAMQCAARGAGGAMLLTEGFLGWGFLGLVKHSSMVIRYPDRQKG
jgi:hypothetical protein